MGVVGTGAGQSSQTWLWHSEGRSEHSKSPPGRNIQGFTSKILETGLRISRDERGEKGPGASSQVIDRVAGGLD